MMDDLISREAAIAAADRADYTGFTVEDVKTVTDEVVKELKLLPSVQQERKRSEWLPHIEKSREYIGTFLVSVEYDYWFCDACGYRVENGQPMYNFCPNCGADMRGEVQND